jgi:hypothetical protein
MLRQQADRIAELENKLTDFYNALKWEMASADSQNAKKFFEF